MKKFFALLLLPLLLVAATVLTPIDMQPNSQVTLTCPTKLSSSRSAHQYIVYCASGSSAPTATPTATPMPTPITTQTPTPTPTPTIAPTPTASPSGLPVIPTAYGTLFRKVFTDGTIGPFKVLTYPDDHIGGSGQYMTVYNRFRHTATHTLVHDGYLDLWALRRTDGSGLWDSDLVGTSQSGNGPTFGYGIYRIWASFNIGPGTWQSTWLYDTTNWSANEIDFPEMLENLNLTAHVITSGGSVGKYGLVKPADLATVFHEFKIERRSSFTAFSIDGTEVWRVTAPEPSTPLAILLDSKVGFGWVTGGQITSQTPNPTYLHIAAVTVDP